MTESATPLTDRSASTRDAVRGAAAEEFAQFGYRRSSMDGIARRAGVSRATLYLHWASKEELFRDVIETLHASALEAMESAVADSSGPLAERWGRMLAARFSRFVHLTQDSPVAAELYDAHARLCADIADTYEQRTRALLTGAVDDAIASGDLDLGPAGASVADVVAVLEQLAHGGKAVSAEPGGPSYDEAVHGSVRMLLAGLANRSS